MAYNRSILESTRRTISPIPIDIAHPLDSAINKAWSSNAISSLSVPSVDGSASSGGSRSGTLLRSERTCASGEHGTGKNDVNTHVVQIVNKPSQVLALQTCCTIFVFIPAEEVDEPVVELRRSSVEIVEFLQGAWQVHGDNATKTATRADKNKGPPPRVCTGLVSSNGPHELRRIPRDG